jgi:2-polyprenyl-3-methyl-5-hydroxy-6-metoxy-1,4-benzoquinol methylase
MKKCRFCRTPLTVTFVDLGMSPLSNSYVKPSQLNQMEPFYPLHVFVCRSCFLVQLEEFESPKAIFSDYSYFSSYSSAWLAHAKAYVEKMTARLSLTPKSQVIEIASNDGYLLQYFKKINIPVLGIEPAANVAKVALKKGIPTRVKFFGVKTAKELKKAGLQADLLLGNNVLAHVPDINDFVGGLKIALKSSGVITMEFPHVLNLIQNNQFDTIYHEHFSYLSLLTVEKIFRAHKLKIFDVEELRTHGGSLRIFAGHADNKTQPVSRRVHQLRRKEISARLNSLAGYTSFQIKVAKVKYDLIKFLSDARLKGKRVMGYGAPAKGNTLLNVCGVTRDLLPLTVDRSPHKQGLFLPGTHIPISPPQKINQIRPDFILILPWNIKDEIVGQMKQVHRWGGKFVVPIPKLKVL